MNEDISNNENYYHVFFVIPLNNAENFLTAR